MLRVIIYSSCFGFNCLSICNLSGRRCRINREWRREINELEQSCIALSVASCCRKKKRGINRNIDASWLPWCTSTSTSNCYGVQFWSSLSESSVCQTLFNSIAVQCFQMILTLTWRWRWFCSHIDNYYNTYTINRTQSTIWSVQTELQLLKRRHNFTMTFWFCLHMKQNLLTRSWQAMIMICPCVYVCFSALVQLICSGHSVVIK